MEDLGAPSSYRTLEPGAPVYSSDGERVGKVAEVRADPQIDIFDGLVLDPGGLPMRRLMVEADQVEEIFERGVLLTIDRAAVESLPEPRS